MSTFQALAKLGVTCVVPASSVQSTADTRNLLKMPQVEVYAESNAEFDQLIKLGVPQQRIVSLNRVGQLASDKTGVFIGDQAYWEQVLGNDYRYIIPALNAFTTEALDQSLSNLTRDDIEALRNAGQRA